LAALVLGALVLGALVFAAPALGTLVFAASVFDCAAAWDSRDARGALTRRMFSGVLGSKCPPSAFVESADAAWRPVESRRCGHRCPHTFCPLTDGVKS
jgi:hypothetical protein